MSPLDNIEFAEAIYTPLDHIIGDYENLYLEQGGSLTYKQQDECITRLCEYTRQLEVQLGVKGK